MDRFPQACDERPTPISELVRVMEQHSCRPELSAELETLEAILADQSADCRYQTSPNPPLIHSIALIIHLDLSQSVCESLLTPNSDTHFELLLKIPEDYPAASAPKAELLAKYIGPFKVDQELSQSIRDISFANDREDVHYQPQLLYEVIVLAKELVEKFYLDRLESRQTNRPASPVRQPPAQSEIPDQSSLSPLAIQLQSSVDLEEVYPEQKDFLVHSTPPIIDRKSTFVGHSVSLQHPQDVPRILQKVLSDKKIAKATHNMVAWRCELNGRLHQDCDDDGESAAGSRMLHLLNILNVNNVFVCVSRWFGGIHLGADRFKHINQATRDALVVGHFIPAAPSSLPGTKKKR